MDERDSDKKFLLVPSKESGKSRRPVSLDVVKSAYIARGLSIPEIAKEYALPEKKICDIVEKYQLSELRQAHVRAGIEKIRNIQIGQAEKLMNIEADFKSLRIIQLEAQLRDYAAYYERHGDFYKRDPISGEILKNLDGIPMQLNVPNVTRELYQLKESVTLSEGLKKVLAHVDDIINPPEQSSESDDDVIDMENIDDLFKQKG